MSKDYEKIVEKLKSFGGYVCLTLDNKDDEFEADTNVECWNLHGEAIIAMIHENGKYGLYHFVGESGDPVEKDIEFLDGLFKKHRCRCGHGSNDHFNAGERNICAGGKWNDDIYSENQCKCEVFELDLPKNILAEQLDFAQRHGE